MWLVYSIRSLRSHWTLGDSWLSSQLNTADPSSSVSTCSRCLMIFNLLTAGKEKIFLMYWICLICALKMLHEKLLVHMEDYIRECRLCLILMVWVKFAGILNSLILHLKAGTFNTDSSSCLWATGQTAILSWIYCFHTQDGHLNPVLFSLHCVLIGGKQGGSTLEPAHHSGGRTELTAESNWPVLLHLHIWNGLFDYQRPLY